MTPREIDDILRRSAAEVPEDESEGVRRAKNSILASLTPVRPMASAAALAVRFFLVFLGVGIAGAAVIGIYGVRALSPLERAIIFPVVTAAAAFAAIASAREMRPAGGRRIGGMTFIAGSLGLLVVFALFFHDYSMQKFVKQGVGCLRAGLEFSVVAAFAVWILLRRGYILNIAAAGLAAGTIAGLAGLGALELHCPNLKAMHVMVWHLAVLVISGIGGLAIGYWAERRKTKWDPGR